MFTCCSSIAFHLFNVLTYTHIHTTKIFVLIYSTWKGKDLVRCATRWDWLSKFNCTRIPSICSLLLLLLSCCLHPLLLAHHCCTGCSQRYKSFSAYSSLMNVILSVNYYIENHMLHLDLCQCENSYVQMISAVIIAFFIGLSWDQLNQFLQSCTHKGNRNKESL